MALRDYFEGANASIALTRYTNAVPASWNVSHKLDLYAAAKIAFESDLPLPEKEVAFNHIYNSLISGWQVFRPKRADECWSASKIFNVLTTECKPCSRASMSLLDLGDKTRHSRIKACLENLGELKPTARYPAVYPWMAVAKFLHFFNPTLFPIYDTAFMWDEVANGVFRLDYTTFCHTNGFNPKEDTARFNLQYTLWASELIRGANAAFMEIFSQWFASRVENHPDPENVLGDVDRYYAAAFEIVAIGAASR